MHKLKKDVIVIFVLLCIALAYIVFYCLTKSQTLLVSFENLQVTSAKTLDFRPSEPKTHDLSAEEIADLESQLVLLKAGKRDDDLLGLTPLYSLTIYSRDVDPLIIASFNEEGSNMAIIYRDIVYRIEGRTFSQYLNDLCAGRVDL